MAHRVTNKNLVQGLLVLILICFEFSFQYCAWASVLSPSTSSIKAQAVSPTSIPTVVSESLTPSSTPTKTSPKSSASASPSPSSTRTVKEPKIKESLIIPSLDSEREAEELYDKALKQYGSYGASARNICAIWELRSCQCSGTIEELTLSCRGLGYDDVPSDLPLDITKL